MSVEECQGWAPGLDLPQGMCVHCRAQRHDHTKKAQSRASGAVGTISAAEFGLADSPLARHPGMISPATSAAKIRPDVVFCRSCNQGLIIKDADPDTYQCPKCGSVGPKSKSPTGKLHGETHAPPVTAEKTLNQRAFEDGLVGNAPIVSLDPGTVGYDSLYAEWYTEGKRRRDEEMAKADAAAGIVDGETGPVEENK